MTEFDNLTWLHGKPQGSGLLKANPEDFVVVEDLGFTPDGEGEHILLRILKNGCNTRFVADALAKFLKIHAREVSFAGQKDKHAVTEQWLCARVPGKEMPDFSAFQLEGCKVLEYARHKRKLRLGALKGNAFTLVLREISDRRDVETRLQAIRDGGVPNYFGAQRFGIGGSNKMLPNNKPAGTVVTAPVTAPTVSTTEPNASSTSTSAPISAWRWPTDGKVIENFGASEGGNKGIDIAGSKGQAIVATADGRVVYAGNALRGYGNLIIIKHNDDYLSAYAHNDTMLVREQQEVKAGQKIATMGSTGTSSTRLHFEIRYKGKSVNPLRYLPQR
ncbi:hypothetical protein DNS01_05325 [Salmonella enterica]|nr:hypothetical protein [Salmonella enterica]